MSLVPASSVRRIAQPVRAELTLKYRIGRGGVTLGGLAPSVERIAKLNAVMANANAIAARRVEKCVILNPLEEFSPIDNCVQLPRRADCKPGGSGRPRPGVTAVFTIP